MLGSEVAAETRLGLAATFTGAHGLGGREGEHMHDEHPYRVVGVLKKRMSDFEKAMQHGIVIDTRSPDAFAAAHIPGSYNIWLEGVPAFGGWVANENTRIFLVVDGPKAMEQAAGDVVPW
mgnify:CR=1 FL=1